MAENQSPPEAEKDRSERWLLTYSDLVTLLLIFFIVLYVMSKQDAVKFESMAESLSEAFKGTKQVIGEATGPSFIKGRAGALISGPQSRTREELKMEYVKQEVERFAQEESLAGQISVTMEDRGVVIRITEQVLFASGSADVSPASYKTVQIIGGILKVARNQYIRIEGHTDNLPIANSRFPSNWELSSARAAQVLRLLVEKGGIDPRLLAAVGYGEFRPLTDNRTPESRRKNRRVEIVVLKHELNKSES